MSEWVDRRPPLDSSNASDSGHAPSRTTQHTSAPVPSDQHDPRASAPTSTAASPALHRHPSTNNGRTMELPPLPRALSGPGGAYSPASRSIGVSSILNHPDADESLQSRRRKAAHLESPSSSMHILPPLVTSDPGHRTNSSGPTPTSTGLAGSVGERAPRRILTPRSPSLHRAASLNQIMTPSATLSTQQAPLILSPRNRTITTEPGSMGALPLPTPPPASRQSYGFTGPTPHAQSVGRTSGSSARGMRPASESMSPRSSYSGYSQAASPTTSSAPGLHVLSSAYSAGHEGSGPDRQRPLGVPISSSGGQNVYQMMTLETTSGTVQLPVDVQAASRVADEKRRRNAGASARFRQRRKEKEKEASTTISRLEQQVKELGEDMDFYKRERDYLAGVVLSTQGGDRHFPRPASPRLRRSSGPSSGGYMSIHDQDGRSTHEGRNLRRRTSTLSLPPPPQPPGLQQGPPPPIYQQAYAPQYGQPLAPQPPGPHLQTAQPGSAPLPSPHGRVSLPPMPPGPPGPPSLMQAPPQTGPWNPYADRRPAGGSAPGREGR